jgi:anthranilate phosphoribosyltransferase
MPATATNDIYHMKEILYKLFDYQYLTRDEAKQVLFDIVSGNVPEAQISALLTTFLMRSISVDEILGFRDALLDMRVPIDLSEYRPIDIVGTGGDGKNTFNISTLAAFVIAGAGYPVAKHGNYGATSVSGASNVLELHGAKFTTDANRLKRSIEKCGFVYLHAPFFSPALKAVAGVRKSLGVRNFFNIMGPLVNPTQPPYQVLGVYDLSMMRLFSYIYQESKKNFSIVHSIDGYDEISLTSQFKVVSNRGEQLFVPGDLGLRRASQAELSGGETPEDAARIFDLVLRCEATEAQMNAVLVNAAFGIRTIEQDKSIDDCLDQARDSLYGKKALKTFNQYIELNS